jgi:hypothetical protein
MDTLTARERVTGNGPTHKADVRDTPTGTEKNQITLTMKIVDNSTKLENGMTSAVMLNLHLFVNMVPELIRSANLMDTSLPYPIKPSLERGASNSPA